MHFYHSSANIPIDNPAFLKGNEIARERSGIRACQRKKKRVRLRNDILNI